MRIVMIAAAALAGAASTAAFSMPAHADTARMSTNDFVRAHRCVALAQAPTLSGDGFSAQRLNEHIVEQSQGRYNDVLTQARRAAATEVRDARAAVTPAAVERMRAKRNRLCSAFADLTSTGGAATGG